MKSGKRLWILALEIALGAALAVLCQLRGWDPRWQGMGIAVVVVALLQLLRALRYARDTEYREHCDTETKDERNAYIRQMAWLWAGTAFIFIGGLLTVVFLILKNDLMTKAASGSVCLLLVLYWAFYLILQKKY